MARTLPEGDPRYATNFLPRMDGAGCPPGGGGASRFMVALAAPLPGTTYAGTRWSTLAYTEKVRPQFLSLHHPVSANRTFPARRRIARFCGDFRPLSSRILVSAGVREFE